jgi:hypothetical protein
MAFEKIFTCNDYSKHEPIVVTWIMPYGLRIEECPLCAAYATIDALQEKLDQDAQ